MNVQRHLVSLSLFSLVLSLSASNAFAQDPVDFVKDVQPILAQHCYKCHGEKADKGDLRLHTPEAIKDSETVVANELDDSELFIRLVLPHDDDSVMPKGSPPLAASDVDIIRRWIATGAEMKGAAGAATPMADAGPKEEVLVISPAPAEAVKKIKEAGILILPLAKDDNRLYVTFGGASNGPMSEQIQLLEPIAEQLTWLNLAKTEISDADLEVISKLKNLTTLHLENTNISDKGVAMLSGLANLEYLNLYGTQTTDAALASLADLAKLKKLYVWNTKVSYKAATEFTAKHPELEINLGENNPDVMKAKLEARLTRANEKLADANTLAERATSEKDAATSEIDSIKKQLESLK